MSPELEQALADGFASQFAIATRTKEEHLAACAREWEYCQHWAFGTSTGFVAACRALGLDPEAVRAAARKKIAERKT